MAIKAIPIQNAIHISREIDVIKVMNHENVVNYYFREEDQRYVYIGLSLCFGHLGDVIQVL
jgi:hypothetical protein